MRLKGKICVVTGAGGRIGRAIVDKFVQEGAHVLAADIVPLSIDGVESVVLDQSSDESIDAFEEFVSSKYGHVDCLVNNAALGGNRHPLHEKPISEFDAIMAVNVRGPFRLSQVAIRLMLASKTKGVIINVASTSGSLATSGSSAYSLSKSALLSLAKSIAAEYAVKGIRGVTLSPGFMDVPNIQGFSNEDFDRMIHRVPAQRGGYASEVANVAAFLASDEASYVNGTEVRVDGGFTAL